MLAPGAALDLDVDAGFEHGVLVDTGVVVVDEPSEATSQRELAYVAPGRDVARG